MGAIIAADSDVFVHHWQPTELFEKIETAIEDWGQYANIPGDDLQANHVECVYSDTQVARMNPPKSQLYPMSQAPLSYIKPFRLNLSPLLSKFRYLPEEPLYDPDFCAVWELEIQAHLGEEYGWATIERDAVIGVLGRLDPAAAQKMLKDPSPILEIHARDCSVWTTERINSSVNKAYAKLFSISGFVFDLFDGRFGKDEPRPADFPTSQYLKPIVYDSAWIKSVTKSS
jgi:hypothetical protein